MENFQLLIPTNLVCQRGIEREVASFIKPFSTRILIVIGGDFIKESEWYQYIVKSLQNENIVYCELEGINANPELLKVKEGIEVCKRYQLSFVLSIGGGSCIDTAKAIAAGAKFDGDPWRLFEGKATVQDALPVGTIMTIMSTGSEGSNGAVITNEQTREKLDIMSDVLRPVFCLMNPEITYSVPEHQVYCGIADMFSHVVERYFSPSDNVYVTDHLCIGLMKAIVEVAAILKEDFLNYDARANLMLASIYAHNNIVGVGRIQDWATHALGAPLSGIYNITHAETITVLMPQWATYVYQESIPRFIHFAEQVFSISNTPGSEREKALKGIEALAEFFKMLGMPLRLRDIGIVEEIDLTVVASQVISKGEIGGVKKLGYQDVLNIFNMAL
ncbi:iron-containing alcohol dehydrogenase [Citrobacter portucalensis]|uniref:iron-containing alcohol dehydrogenase n=1 Tax=Citrobacter portucalensis TaxID=1639133 RepID=UPI002597C27E|nr:iron-containing alcohol dehydrogenase [uncultured Citrobacter sp.]